MTRRPFFNPGDVVIVNTGGADVRATISNSVPFSNLKESVLCRFENQTAQWIPTQYIRHAEVRPTTGAHTMNDDATNPPAPAGAESRHDGLIYWHWAEPVNGNLYDVARFLNNVDARRGVELVAVDTRGPALMCLMRRPLTVRQFNTKRDEQLLIEQEPRP